MYLTEINTNGHKAYLLNPPSITLGSSDVNDITISSSLVSRQHAVIEKLGSTWTIRDLNSTNGLYLNSVITSYSEIETGDVLAFADVQLLFSDSPELPAKIPGSWKVSSSGDSLFDNAPNLAEPNIESQKTDTKSDKSLFSSLLSRVGINKTKKSSAEDQNKIQNLPQQDYFYSLVNISEQVNSGGDLKKALKKAAKTLMTTVNGQRCFFYVSHKETNSLSLFSRAALDSSKDADPLVHQVCTGVYEQSRSWISFEQNHTIAAFPLKKGDDTLGVFYCDSHIKMAAFNETDTAFIKSSCQIISSSLAADSMRHELIKKSRTEEELAIAAQIQQNLYPSRAPFVKGFDVFGKNIPAKEIGGDYYDFFLVDDEHLAIVICDVSGKGVPAGIIAAMLRAVIHSDKTLFYDLPLLMSKLNTLLCTDIEEGMYATAFIGLLNIPEKELVYCSAGHEPSIVSKPGNPVLRNLDVRSMAVGMFEEAMYNTGTIKLKMGERLVCYTDGVTDLQNPDGEEFGADRFETFIQECVAADPKIFFDETFEILKRFQGPADQADDITMIVIDVLMPWAKQSLDNKSNK